MGALTTRAPRPGPSLLRTRTRRSPGIRQIISGDAGVQETAPLVLLDEGGEIVEQVHPRWYAGVSRLQVCRSRMR